MAKALTKGLILTSFRAFDLKKSQDCFCIPDPDPLCELVFLVISELSDPQYFWDPGMYPSAAACFYD